MKNSRIVHKSFLVSFLMLLLISFVSCRPMCPLDSCRVLTYHQHTEMGIPPKWQKKISKKKQKGKDMVFYWRGSRWWKKQNARLGEKHRADAKKKTPRKKIRKKKNNLKQK